MDSIFNRASVRKYKDVPLKKNEIEKILKAGFSAPSAANKQPWQFIVVENKETLVNLGKMTPYAKPLEKAALGIVACADLNVGINIDYCQQDVAAATENMLIEANSLGIGSCWLGVYPEQERMLEINAYFKLPKGIIPLWMISFGYPDEKINVKEKWNEEKIHYEKY